MVELAAGELAPERFRYYVEQNLHYLPQYARVMALGAAKSRDQHQLELFSGALHQVIDVELRANRELRDRVLELEPLRLITTGVRFERWLWDMAYEMPAAADSTSGT